MNIMVIKDNVVNEIVINKSRFITYLYKIKNKDEFNNYLELLQKKYKDATHICYAYIINSEIKFSDDKEPNGSAGLPIYEVLKQNNLNYIVCFVIRYFGGIKLGGSGLIRAYSNSTSLCLKKTDLIEYIPKYKIQFYIPYSKASIIEKIIDKDDILEKTFNDNIIYIVLVTQNNLIKFDKYQIPYTILEENIL